MEVWVGTGTLRATMQDVAHDFIRFGSRGEAHYGNDNTFYMSLRGTEEDEQSLGSGQTDVLRHHFYAVGHQSRDEQRHCCTLRRRLRSRFAEPFSGRLEATCG